MRQIIASGRPIPEGLRERFVQLLTWTLSELETGHVDLFAKYDPKADWCCLSAATPKEKETKQWSDVDDFCGPGS